MCLYRESPASKLSALIPKDSAEVKAKLEKLFPANPNLNPIPNPLLPLRSANVRPSLTFTFIFTFTYSLTPILTLTFWAIDFNAVSGQFIPSDQKALSISGQSGCPHRTG
jgi:hypothetical protein